MTKGNRWVLLSGNITGKMAGIWHYIQLLSKLSSYDNDYHAHCTDGIFALFSIALMNSACTGYCEQACSNICNTPSVNIWYE